MLTRSCVGNDVVDLTDPQIVEHHRRARFIERVCAPEEVPRATGDERALWSLFAAKEAAYKALVKLGVPVGFAHRALVVDDGWRAVSFGDVRLALHVEGDEAHVHAVAWTGARPTWAVARTRREPSSAARALLVDLLRRAGAEDVRVVRDPLPGSWDGYGPPRLVSGEGDVSLSHDRGFVACAAALSWADAR